MASSARQVLPAWVVIFLSACRSPSVLPVPTEGIEWRPFYWAQVESLSVRFARAAILVEPPPRFQDKGERLLQLDLAASGTLPDGFPSTAGHEVDGDLPKTARQVRLAGLLRGFGTMHALDAGGQQWKQGRPVPEIGTYGLPAFSLGLLMVDMARQRIGTAPAGALPPAFWEQVPVIPIQTEDDRILVPLATAGDLFTGLLDTGLIPFPLWTSCDRFQALTGLSPRGTQQVRIGHPRGALTFARGRTRDAVSMGTVSLGRLDIVCLIDGPPGVSVERWGQPFQAVLGATAFDRATVLVIDFRSRRSTVVASRRFPAK